MFKVIIDQLAENDVDEIFSWYESNRADLGFEFLTELEQCIYSLEKSPFAYYNVSEKVRRITIARFPYNIYYTIDTFTVYIHVVMHQHKDPAEWQTRLK